MSKAAVQQHPPRVDSSAMNQNRNAWRSTEGLPPPARGGCSPPKKKQQSSKAKRCKRQRANKKIPIFFFPIFLCIKLNALKMIFP